MADLGLLCDAFAVHDDAPPRSVALAGARFALCRTPMWPHAEPGTREAMAAAAERLRAADATVMELTLPPAFDRLTEVQATIMLGEGRAAFLDLARRHGSALHDDFHARAENRTGITRAALLDAYDTAAGCRTGFDALAGEYDAVIVPSARGEAPAYADGPGDAVFNRMWTLLHGPSVNVPAVTGPDWDADRGDSARAALSGPPVAGGCRRSRSVHRRAGRLTVPDALRSSTAHRGEAPPMAHAQTGDDDQASSRRRRPMSRFPVCRHA